LLSSRCEASPKYILPTEICRKRCVLRRSFVSKYLSIYPSRTPLDSYPTQISKPWLCARKDEILSCDHAAKVPTLEPILSNATQSILASSKPMPTPESISLEDMLSGVRSPSSCNLWWFSVSIFSSLSAPLHLCACMSCSIVSAADVCAASSSLEICSMLLKYCSMISARTSPSVQNLP
jgi:hypothetical protein